MWGGPTPHNLETLCLCYADQTSSEVPISSSNWDTIRKGGETAFSFPRSSLPRCRVIITQREVLIRLGILSDANTVKPKHKALGIPSRLWRLWGKTPACSSISWLDAKRNPELVTFNAMSKGSKDYVMLKQRTYTFLLITFLIFKQFSIQKKFWKAET